MKFTYLLVNLGALIIPLLFSFHPKIKFFKKWGAFFLATLITGVPFILWDVFYTEWGVWGFNENYLLGIYCWGLPLEEYLFFICIPYASVFTYHSITKLTKWKLKPEQEKWTSLLLIIILLTGAGLGFPRLYTTVTSLALVAVIFILRKLNPILLTKFYLVYGIILIPFFLVNGILTGAGLEEEVVWYNNHENLGIRIYTIPIEDIFYGMMHLMLIIYFFEWFKQKIGKPLIH